VEPPEVVRILIVEDSLTVAGMLEDLLKTEFDIEVRIARDCKSTRKILSEETFDIIMLDYRLPDGHGHQLLEETKELEKPPLAIMVTGHGDEDIAALSLRLGAFGYVVKDSSLSSVLPDVIEKALNEIALSRAEEKLLESEERYRLLADNSLSGIVLHDGFNILYTNESVSRICGYPEEHFTTIKDILNLLVPGERDRVVKYMKSRLSGEEAPEIYDTRLTRKDGSIAEIQLMNTLTRLKGKLVILVTINDITERVNAQNALKEEKAFIEAALNTLPDIHEDP
jgi:PAS domain S-box-containing protein